MKRMLVCLALATSSAYAAQVKFDWDASAGATSYKLYCGTVSGALGTAPLGTSTTNTVTVTLAPGPNFCAVSAVNAVAESAKSAELAVPIPPAAPGNLRFSVQVVWDDHVGAYVVALVPIKE